ncbi:MOXD1 homolog 1-like [Lycorma delicatula]|uniref:MOXD1 homolog 1-like n=1 Tax=Lycorma delicatula TaxID=130591 RepID=UPI003F50F867
MTVVNVKCAVFVLFYGWCAYGFNVNETIELSLDNLEWTHSAVLDSVRLSWTPMEDKLMLMVEAATRGYFVLGFSHTGSISGADVIIGWVDDVSGKPYLMDFHGVEKNETPLVDSVQSYELVKGLQNETHTVLLFHRNWNTCDDNDVVLGPDTVHIHWTVQDKDPVSESDMIEKMSDLLLQDEKKWLGTRSLHLTVKSAINHPDKENMRYWDITLDNFAVPDNMDTYYWCKIFKVPPLGKKHHMIGYEPLLSPNSGLLVHHMLLYECVGVPLEKYATHDGSTCYAQNMPQDWDACLSPIVAWAIGSQGEFFPEHVGLPLAENDRSTYFMLEIHYDNPTLRKVVDSSGLRLYYTDKLRDYDGGVLISGVTVSPLHIIPPKQPKFKTAGYCDQHCTRLMLPTAGIRVVSVLLHSHLAGRSITLKHIRNDIELPAIAEDKNYDFNYQQSRVLSKEIRVLPGDELITECVYDTKNRTQPTYGGYSTKQEMCLAFIVYYPRTPLASCLSMTPVEYFFKTFGVTEFYKYNMSTVEKMFLKLTENQITKPQSKSTTPPSFPMFSPEDVFDAAANEAAIMKLKEMPAFTVEEVEGGSLLSDLIIKESQEFVNKTFTAHLQDIPWQEQMLTQRIEQALYYGKHMTFCRLNDDTLAMPSHIYSFPNYTVLSDERQTSNKSMCITELKSRLPYQTENSSNGLNAKYLLLHICSFLLLYVNILQIR